LTIHDFEKLCPEINRRTLQRVFKNLLEDKKLIKEIGKGSTDPTRYYELAEL